MIARRIITGLLFLLFLLLLELNQNTFVGWVLAVMLTFLFVFSFEAGWLNRSGWLKFGAWIAYFGLFAAIFFLTWPPMKRVPAYETKSYRATEVVKLKDGDLTGVVIEDGQVEVFAGIPYAKAPVGDLRWKAPEDPEPWTGVLKADTFAPMNYQPRNLPLYYSLYQIIGYHDYRWLDMNDNYRPAVSEDGLYLNLWRPAGEKKDLPVIVYVHGGSLQTGQPWYADYGGKNLAKRDRIEITFGYRLGVFGYLALEELREESDTHTTGNYGLLDQVKLLQWVKDNIASFGGDPDNVTLAGESAGSAAVSALSTSPLAKGLFRRTILESSTVASKEPPHSFRLLDEALQAGAKVLKKYNCTSVKELRNVPADQLVASTATEHHMTIDGYALTELPYDSYRKGVHNEEAILHGYNAEESAAFILFDKTTMANYESKVRSYFKASADDVLKVYPASSDDVADYYWAVIFVAVFFDYPHFCLNRLANEAGIPVYEYYFSKANGRIGAYHSGEEIYAYANIPEKSGLFDETDRELMRIMSSYWVNFSKDGDPNGDGVPEWPKNADNDTLMEFGTDVRPIGEKSRKLAFFEALDRMQGFGD